MALLFVIFFISYLAFALFFIKSTWKTSNKIQRAIVLSFFILLPTWDYVLGCVLYYASWPFFPKKAIYEIAKVDGIYFDGAHRSKIQCVKRDYLGKIEDTYEMTFSDDDLKKGYKYSEALIKHVKICPARPSSEVPTLPAVYRCTPLPRDPKNPKYIYQQCDPAENIISGYAVELHSIKIGSFEMNSMNIHNRTTGKLMAEYKEIVRWNHLPFFKWLDWTHFSAERHSKPQETLFYDFQYEVLKPRDGEEGK